MHEDSPVLKSFAFDELNFFVDIPVHASLVSLMNLVTKMMTQRHKIHEVIRIRREFGDKCSSLLANEQMNVSEITAKVTDLVSHQT